VPHPSLALRCLANACEVPCPRSGDSAVPARCSLGRLASPPTTPYLTPATFSQDYTGRSPISPLTCSITGTRSFFTRDAWTVRRRRRRGSIYRPCGACRPFLDAHQARTALLRPLGAPPYHGPLRAARLASACPRVLGAQDGPPRPGSHSAHVGKVLRPLGQAHRLRGLPGPGLSQQARQRATISLVAVRSQAATRPPAGHGACRCCAQSARQGIVIAGWYQMLATKERKSPPARSPTDVARIGWR